MIGLVINLIVLLMLVSFWLMGEAQINTKLIFTGVYLATWLLIFVDVWAHLGAQALFGLVVGAMTFGGGASR